MPTTIGNLHIDTLLSTIAGAYKNASYVADRVLPIIPVAKESGLIAQYGNEHMRTADIEPRAFGSRSYRGDWQAASTLSYSAVEWSVEKPVDDRERALYDDPFDALRDATIFCQEKVLAKREALVGTLLSTGGNFGATSVTASNKWNTSSGTAATDIRTQMMNIVKITGADPSSMIGVCSLAVWNALVNNAEFRTLYINTQPGAGAPGMIDKQTAASALGLKDIVVSSAVYNSAREGGTDSFTWCFGATTFAVIAQSATPTLMNPGYGAILSPIVPGLPGAAGVVVDTYREEQSRSTVVRASALFKEVYVTKNLGGYITNCL